VSADPVWYFAYGSNMSRAIFCERRRMCPTDSRWGWLHGWRLSFELPVGPGERGVANVVPDAAARTCGVLHRITADEFDRLDRTEGVHVDIYRRVPVEVVTESGERVPAQTYVSTRATAGRKPSARYLGLLLTGAREHDLPRAWIEFLAAHELAFDEREASPAQ